MSTSNDTTNKAGGMDLPAAKLNINNHITWTKQVTDILDMHGHSEIVNWMCNRHDLSAEDDIPEPDDFFTPLKGSMSASRRQGSTSPIGLATLDEKPDVKFKFTQAGKVPRPDFVLPDLSDFPESMYGQMRVSIWQRQVTKIEDKAKKFRENCALIWGWLHKTAEETLIQKVENNGQNYLRAKHQLDLPWLWNELCRASTGTVAQSASMAVMTLLNTQLSGNDFHGFFNAWLEAERRIKDHVMRGDMTYQQLFEQFIDSLFMVNMTKGDTTQIASEINQALALPQLPHPGPFIIRLTRIIEGAQRMQALQQGEGKITANKATVKRNRGRVCFMCDQTGHPHWKCPKLNGPPSDRPKCDTCGKYHLTKHHEQAKASDDKFAAKNREKETVKNDDTALLTQQASPAHDYWMEEPTLSSYLCIEETADPNDPNKPPRRVIIGDMNLDFDPDSGTDSDESNRSRRERMERNTRRQIARDRLATLGLPEPGRAYGQGGFNPSANATEPEQIISRLRGSSMIDVQEIMQVYEQEGLPVPNALNHWIYRSAEAQSYLARILQQQQGQQENERTANRFSPLEDTDEPDNQTSFIADIQSTESCVNPVTEHIRRSVNVGLTPDIRDAFLTVPADNKHITVLPRQTRAITRAITRSINKPGIEEEMNRAIDMSVWHDTPTYLPILDDSGVFQTWKTIRGMPGATRETALMTTADDDTASMCAILDSGSSGHVVRSTNGLTHITPVMGRSVVGITGNRINITHTANHPLLGHVNVVPDASSDLISVPRLMSKGMTMTCNLNSMTIKDNKGNVFVTGKRRYDGLYEANLGEIRAYLISTGSAASRQSEPEPTYNVIRKKKDDDEDDDDHNHDDVFAYNNITIPLNQHEMARAHEARDLHVRMGHPGRDAEKQMLDNGILPNINLTSKDFDNAEKLLGPCASCILGKMTAPPEPSREDDDLDVKVGERIYCDLQLQRGKVPSLGGNTQLLLARDRRSSLFMCVAMKSKEKDCIYKACTQLSAFMKSHGHTTKHFVFDNEPTLVAAKVALEKDGFQTTYSPTGLHNKVIERGTRDVKTRMRCMEADLKYELPNVLYFELMMAAVNCLNSVPNDMTGPTMSPYQLVTGMRPTAKEFKFGQTGICYSPRPDSPDIRAEWCIYLDHVPETPGSYRVYIPVRNDLYSRRKFVPHEHYPVEWGYKSRIQMGTEKYVASVDRPLDNTSSAVSAPTQLKPITNIVQNEPANTQQHAPANATNNTQPDKSTTPSQEPNAATLPVMQDADSQTKPTTDTIAKPTTPVEPTRRSHRSTAGVPPNKLTYQALAASESVDTEGLFMEKYREITCLLTESPSEHSTEYNVTSYRISLKEALTSGTEERQRLSWQAMDEEIKSLMKLKVFKFILQAELPPEDANRVAPCHMFLKEKYNADGSYQKMKARLVAGGNWVDPSLVGDTKAPTAKSISVMTALNRAAIFNHEINTGDIQTAFLIPVVDQSDDKDKQYIRIPANVAKHFVRLFPDLRQYLNQKGELLTRLLKWLYGLPQSAERFATHLYNTMTKLHFRTFIGDKCTFMREELMVVAHVDDLLFTGPKRQMDAFIHDITNEYQMNIQVGNSHSYLGLDIRRGMLRDSSDYAIRVTQNGYRNDVVNRFTSLTDQYISAGRTPLTPCGPDFCDKSAEDAEKVDAKLYASLVMSLMYLARYTRPDILFACSVLSTWCSDPDETHMKRACRVLKYVGTSGDVGITYKKCTVVCTIGADAGHAIHDDGKGHGGHTCSLGSGIIWSRSYKVKMITLSSTETEFCVASDAVKIAKYLNELCTFIGLSVRPAELMQDNTSTIWLSANEGSLTRTAHMMIRRNYVKEAVTEGEVKIIHVPTESMYPDLLTKPNHSPEEVRRHRLAMGVTRLINSTNAPTPEHWRESTTVRGRAINHTQRNPNRNEGVTRQVNNENSADTSVNSASNQPRNVATRAIPQTSRQVPSEARARTQTQADRRRARV